MRSLFLVLSLLVSGSSFADSRSDAGFVKSEKNVAIAREITSRVGNGVLQGVTDDGQKCSVEVSGLQITIKTEQFSSIKGNYDCLSHDNTNISCFEFSDDRYLPQATLFFSGDIFSSKVLTNTAEVFHLKTKRNLGGNGKYELIISNNSNDRFIRVVEQPGDDIIRDLKCNL